MAFADLGSLTYSALLTEVYHNSGELGDLANSKAILGRYVKKQSSSNNVAMVLGWQAADPQGLYVCQHVYSVRHQLADRSRGWSGLS